VAAASTGAHTGSAPAVHTFSLLAIIACAFVAVAVSKTF
jgi:hypothetical protein